MKNDRTDLWTALTIGAVVGIGAALIMRAEQEDRSSAMLRKLRPIGDQARELARRSSKQVGRGLRSAGDAGGDLRDLGEDMLQELRDGARDIVKTTRRELQQVARDAAKDSRRAARRAVRVVRR